MKGDTRILDLFLLFRMSKEEIIGLINEKQPVVFVSGEHAYMVRDYRWENNMDLMAAYEEEAGI